MIKSQEQLEEAIAKIADASGVVNDIQEYVIRVKPKVHTTDPVINDVLPILRSHLSDVVRLLSEDRRFAPYRDTPPR